MINKFTKEQVIKKYMGTLEALKDDEITYGRVLIREQWIEVTDKNKSQLISEVEELIKELQQAIL